MLRQAGYEVHPAGTADDALTSLHGRPFAAIVIGHAVPENDRLKYIEAARALNPDAIVVLLYWDSIRRTEAADAILCIGNGPMALVQALRELLGR
jgi:DNA-binding NtrC family response regulator